MKVGQINKDLADFKAEYEEKISKYIASQDLVGRYFISKINTLNEGDLFVGVTRNYYLYSNE